jgi:hypothetical protein
MSFINSFFLYLLPLVLIPLVIHLIGRQRFYRQEFSTLRFLQQLEQNLIRKLKIRQVILLILRMLLILLIILVFARPYRTVESAGIYIGRGETLYLLMDNSLSMQSESRGSNLLSQGVETLLSAAENIDFPVYVKLVESVAPGEIRDCGLVTDLTSLTKLLQSVNPTNRWGRLDLALQTIRQDVRQHQELNPAIWIVSDFQRSSWQSVSLPVPAILALFNQTDARVIFFPVFGDKHNAALVEAEIPGQILESERTATVRARIVNWGESVLESPVALFLDDQKLGQSLVSVPGAGQVEVQFEFIPGKAGFLAGYIKINDDDLPADNQRFFLLNIPARMRVLVVTRSAGDAEYIQRSLSLKGVSNIETKTVPIELFGIEDLAAWDLLIFTNVDRLPVNLCQRIHDYLNTGKGLLIFPGKDCTPADFNALWGDQFGFPRWRTTRQAEQGQSLRLGKLKPEHPIFRNVWRENRSLIYSPDFYVVPGFSLGKGQTAIASFEDNTPFLIELQTEKGLGLLMASSPVQEWTNLPLTGLFPTLMNRLVLYLARQSLQEPEYFVGDTIRVALSQSEMKTLNILTPDGRSIKVITDKQNGQLSFYETEQPGIYFIISKDQVIKGVVVNNPMEESNPLFLGVHDFKELASQNPGRMDFYSVGGSESESQLHQAREYSDWLILIAFLLALFESYLGRANRKLRGMILNG